MRKKETTDELVRSRDKTNSTVIFGRLEVQFEYQCQLRYCKIDLINTNGDNCLGDDWITVVVVDVITERWNFSVVQILVSKQLVDEVVVIVLSGKAVEGGRVWADGVNGDIPTEDDLADDSVEIYLSKEGGLVNLRGDEVLTEEFFEELNILLGGDCDRRVESDETIDDKLNELSVESTALKNLTEDGGEFNLSVDDSLIDVLGDDVLAEEVLKDDQMTLAQDLGVSGVWNNGIDDITTEKDLAEDGEKINLSIND